jgi:FtsH-binding integral membrane protein
VYEHHRQHPIHRQAFLKRLAGHLALALLLVLSSLGLGVVGFHVLSGQQWIDALVNSAMLLGGMGPVGDLGPPAGKIFASLYALYAGLVFLIVAGLLFAPVFHRILHRFHIDGGK